MTTFKYTTGGKKVVVIGKLNNEQWICQEIFVANGQEFPAGENFVEKTLLDEPAETWATKNMKQLEDRKLKIENEIKRAEASCDIAHRKESVARLIKMAIDRYAQADLSELDTLFAFVSGEITHVIIKHYGDYEIQSLFDAVEDIDNCGYYKRLDGLKLVSLFGCRDDGSRVVSDTDTSNRKFRMDWRINQYRDGSGNCWNTIYPCKSYQDAVAKLDDLIKDQNANDRLIELKKKHKLVNPTAEKIKAYHQIVLDGKRATVGEEKKKLEKMQNELQQAEDEFDRTNK